MRILLVILGGVIIPFAVMALYADLPDLTPQKKAPCVKIENRMKAADAVIGHSTSQIKFENCEF
jgi:hypothetical protein